MNALWADLALFDAATVSRGVGIDSGVAPHGGVLHSSYWPLSSRAASTRPSFGAGCQIIIFDANVLLNSMRWSNGDL